MSLDHLLPPRELYPKIKWVDLGQIGNGSFATIHLAEDRETGRTMAVKVYKRVTELSKSEARSEATWARDVYREIITLSELDHVSAPLSGC